MTTNASSEEVLAYGRAIRQGDDSLVEDSRRRTMKYLLDTDHLSIFRARMEIVF